MVTVKTYKGNHHNRTQFDPRVGFSDYGEVQRYLKMEKLRRHLESQERSKLISSRYISFHEFIPEAFKIVEPRVTYVPNWHITAAANHLMAVTKGHIQNLIINIPPRHMKSLLVSVFWPAWVWTILPEWQFIYASYSSGLSIRDSIKTRRLIQSDWYRSRWSDIVTIREDQNQKTRFENTEGGYRIATSVLGAATGEGGNVIVVDDPHNMKEIFSDYKREEAIEWWNTVMSTRINNPSTDHKVIIAQRGHENDLVGHLIRKMSDNEGEDGEEVDHYETLILPAEYNKASGANQTSIGFKDPRTEEGELLYPSRFPRKVIDTLKTSLGKYSASAQLQQSPTPAGGAIFSISNLRCWCPVHLIHNVGPAILQDTTGQKYKVPVVPLPAHTQISDFQSWDFSFANFDTSDYVVGQVWRYVSLNFYLLHQSKAIRDFNGSLVSIGKTTGKFPQATLKLFELKANGFAIYNSLQHKVPGIVPITPKESKVARAHAVSPLVESFQLIVPHPLLRSWSQDFVTDLISFPFGITDDSVDAMTQALNYKAFGPKVSIS